MFNKDEEKKDRMQKATREFPTVAIEEETSPLVKKTARKGKFVRIAGSEVIVDVNGNGERIPYVPKVHDGLKAGDTVDL